MYFVRGLSSTSLINTYIMRFLDDFLMFLSDNIVIVFLLFIVYLVVRARARYALVKRAIGNKSIWLNGNHIDVDDFFESVKARLHARSYYRVYISYKSINDGYLPNRERRYLKITSHHLNIYLTAFPIEEDGVISYWAIAKPMGILAWVALIPFFGKHIVEIVQTPTLHNYDVLGATRTMIESEIEAAIKEVTESFPTKRISEEDFTSYLQLMTTSKKK